MHSNNNATPRAIEDAICLRVMNDNTYLRVNNDSHKITPTKDPKSVAKIIDPTYVKQKNLKPTHRHLARVTIAKAVTIAQLEQKQITNLEPTTHQFLTDAVNLPNLLKHEELIKTQDKHV